MVDPKHKIREQIRLALDYGEWENAEKFIDEACRQAFAQAVAGAAELVRNKLARDIEGQALPDVAENGWLTSIANEIESLTTDQGEKALEEYERRVCKQFCDNLFALMREGDGSAFVAGTEIWLGERLGERENGIHNDAIEDACSEVANPYWQGVVPGDVLARLLSRLRAFKRGKV